MQTFRYEGSGASQMGLRLEGVSIQDAGIWRLRCLFKLSQMFFSFFLILSNFHKCCHRIRHNNNWVETSFELIVTEYGLTNTEPNSPISIEVKVFDFLGNFFLVLSGLFIHTFLILFAGGRELLNCFQSWGFWTDQQQQVNISKQPRSPCLLFFITFLRQSSFVAPDRGIVWLSPYNSDWKPTFDIEPLLPIQADAPTRPDNWRVRLVQLSKNQFHLVYHLGRCKIISNFIPRYEGSGSGEIGMTLEGASILDRSVQAMI